jgi:hypothetical protein
MDRTAASAIVTGSAGGFGAATGSAPVVLPRSRSAT